MGYEQNCAIRQVPITNGAWVDVVGVNYLPINCNLVIIFNNTGIDIYMKTDPGNANSQVTIQNGQQFEIGAVATPSPEGIRVRFKAGSPDAVCSLLSSAGNVSPVVESIL